MKNIHVLPTQNNKTKIASWIYEDSKITKVGELGLHINNTVGWTNCWSEKELYITNDKEVKDWYIYENKLLHTSTNHSKYEILYGKPIVFTTNQDLINDGVQPIDDEFLEWFVKNPSCAYVELMSLREIGRNEYEIIIPEEEPLYDYGWCKGNVILPKEETTLKLPSLPYEYKPLINKNQETLEENSFTLLEKELIKEAKKVWKEAHPNPIEMALFGAKWQQERLYTEEEVVNIAKLSYNNARVATGNHEVSFNMWFEQFKK